jgi:hypothetical protein
MPQKLDIDDEKVATAAEALRRLRPPPMAAEAWVKSAAVPILSIVDATGCTREELGLALLSAGVAKKSDRGAPLSKSILARALSAGRRGAQSRATGIDLHKIESAVAKAIGQLLPGLTDQLARKAAAEAIRMAQAEAESLAPTVQTLAAAPSQAAAIQPAAEPAPADEIAAFAARRREASASSTPPTEKSRAAIEALAALSPLNLNHKR